jgi:protein-S-isoprenylcysteine O-methyltransferase Ste14
MNLLREWGFSSQWWRGEKGEYWVLGQIILSIGFILLPVYPAIDLDNLSPLWRYTSWAGTVFFGLMAGLLLLLGLLNLGANLTPLPHPKDEGDLVTSGVYGLVVYQGNFA